MHTLTRGLYLNKQSGGVVFTLSIPLVEDKKCDCEESLATFSVDHYAKNIVGPKLGHRASESCITSGHSSASAMKLINGEEYLVFVYED